MLWEPLDLAHAAGERLRTAAAHAVPAAAQPPPNAIDQLRPCADQRVAHPANRFHLAGAPARYVHGRQIDSTRHLAQDARVATIGFRAPSSDAERLHQRRWNDADFVPRESGSVRDR